VAASLLQRCLDVILSVGVEGAGLLSRLVYGSTVRVLEVEERVLALLAAGQELQEVEALALTDLQVAHMD
jgi:hypothetical protein